MTKSMAPLHSHVDNLRMKNGRGQKEGVSLRHYYLTSHITHIKGPSWSQ